MQLTLLLALAPFVGGRRPRRLEKLASDYDSLVSAVAHDETTSTVRVKLADSATPVPLEHAVGGAPRRTFRPAGVHEARHVAAGLDRGLPDGASSPADDRLADRDRAPSGVSDEALAARGRAPGDRGAAAAMSASSQSSSASSAESWNVAASRALASAGSRGATATRNPRASPSASSCRNAETAVKSSDP